MNQQERDKAAQARLTALVPQFYRTPDAAATPGGTGEGAEPLLQLLRVLAAQGSLVEEDIARLYDGWFIETCDDWVVPYIGALVGAPPLPGATADGQRRFVANTLAYRRRKGTARVLEQLAADVTGWSALAVEAFRGLALNQSLLQVRPGQGGTADLRDATRAGAAGGPFDAFAHTIDTRRPGDMGARWSIPAIGLFLWRLEPWLLQDVAATPAPGRPWLFHADPDRLPRPWSNPARSDSSVDQVAREADLPVLLRRRPLADQLRQRRFALAAGATPPTDWFGTAPDDPHAVFRIATQAAAGGPWQPVAPEQMRLCNLAGTTARPDAAIPARDGGGTAALLVDPVTGCIAVPTGGAIPHAIRLDHWIGYATEIGAGPFDRNDALAAVIGTRPIDWQAGVRADRAAIPAENLFAALEDALAAWSALPAQRRLGLILIEDSTTHALPAGLTISLRDGETLVIAAGRWPFDGATPLEQRFGAYDVSAVRPHLTGAIRVAATGDDSAALVLDGLSHAGALEVAPGRLGELRIASCTLDQGEGLQVRANPEMRLSIARSMTGALRLDDIVPSLTIGQSIVHGAPGAPAIRAPGATFEVDDSSVFGSVTRVRELHASNTLFTGPVTVDRLQSGCLRFCYLPPASRAPRPYRCQPETAVQAGADPARVVPQPISLDRASPWYGQLHPLGHPALRHGADDGGEIGAFRNPSSAQLEANVHAATDDDLRVGLATGLFLVT